MFLLQLSIKRPPTVGRWVTRWVYGKIAQNVAQIYFVQIITLLLPSHKRVLKFGLLIQLKNCPKKAETQKVKFAQLGHPGGQADQCTFTFTTM
jgi:hypothetical protein